jgi:hypothetical protein
MPCSDSRDNEPRIVYRNGPDPEYERENARLLAKVDVLTDLLCKTGRARRNKTDIPPEVLNWWDEHCKLDKSRGEPW